jgi:hypothetical protein
VKKLSRPPPPACLATDTAERAQVQRERYAHRHYPSGGWRALWNDLDKDEAGRAEPGWACASGATEGARTA